MLDYFAIFTKGGALLWTLQFTTALKHDPLDALNALVRGCLLEERSSDAAFSYAPRSGAAQALKWTFHNGLGLIFVAVYQKSLSLLYVDELLARVRDAFAADAYAPGTYEYKAFSERFNRILRDCEARADAARRAAVAPALAANKQQTGSGGASGARGSGVGGRAGGAAAAADGAQTSSEEDGSDGEVSAAGAGSGQAAATGAGGSGSDGGGGSSGDGDADAEADAEAEADAPADGAGESGGFDIARLGKVSRKAAGGPPGRRTARRAGELDTKASNASPGKKKKDRVWSGLGRRDDEPERIDYSEGAPSGAAAAPAAAAAALGVSRMEEEDDWEGDDDEDAELAEVAASAKAGGAQPAKARGLLGAFVSKLALGVVGTAALSREQLAPALEDMRRRLMERNVAEAISVQVVDSVAASLEGQRLAGFTGVVQFVRRAFEDALSRILNKRQVDVLADIARARERGRPYVIVFCGVNGVGKSTNLAKIAYWLGQQGCSVLLAACDTFRAGAVEQLKTHAARLGVPLYERGYEKDPAKVAAEAVRAAQRDGRDVVLVDTAGRMQDNEPLMRALSNLIAVNQPDLVLFVGEALVGNDAVDQLVKFNRSLADLAPPAGPSTGVSAGPRAGRQQIIDGIVLTKFDTIDDKVGAALSMVYASGAPVMFVGCGQTYVDLKRLNVRSVVASLLK